MRKETDAKCVRDGNIITAAGAGVAMEFGLKIVETLCGKDMAEKIKNAIIA
jgi:4-methyl-5(b-hydroxyethyl)-thiazole monophosphate biosynthesis